MTGGRSIAARSPGCLLGRKRTLSLARKGHRRNRTAATSAAAILDFGCSADAARRTCRRSSSWCGLPSGGPVAAVARDRTIQVAAMPADGLVCLLRREHRALHVLAGEPRHVIGDAEHPAVAARDGVAHRSGGTGQDGVRTTSVA